MTTAHRSLGIALPVAVAMVAALLALPLRAETEPSDGPAARGLIVRLKQPLANHSLYPRGASPRTREATQESVRWQRVLDEAGLSGASGRVAPRLRPVGRDQQLVDFERPLSRSEAASLREKLMARPDVEWVEPNLRERRLQVPPSDPLFTQQWWLQPVSGSNANALAARLRGVAGFQAPGCVRTTRRRWWRCSTPASPATPTWTGTRPAGLRLRARLGPGRWRRLRQRRRRPRCRPQRPGRLGQRERPRRRSGALLRLSAGEQLLARHHRRRHGGGPRQQRRGRRRRALGCIDPAGARGRQVRRRREGHRRRHALGCRSAGGRRSPANPNPARIINISFGGSAACGPAYQSAVDELRALGVVVVAAAGNEWTGPSRPASCQGVVGVVGLNRDGFKTNYSNFGGQIGISGIATVAGDDAAGAWGPVLADSGLTTLTNLGSTAPAAGGYARLYGTSFAAPQVAGTIAHMLSLNPALSYAQIVTGLRASARPHVSSPKMAECSNTNPGRCICTTATCGAGMLDADRALIYASGLVLPAIQAAVIDNPDIDAALALAPQDRPSNVVQVSSGGSGGGAFGGFWLLALATAALTLQALRRPQRAEVSARRGAGAKAGLREWRPPGRATAGAARHRAAPPATSTSAPGHRRPDRPAAAARSSARALPARARPRRLRSARC